MRTIKISKVLKALEKDGWSLVKYRGSHRQYKHPVKKGKVTVSGKDSDNVCIKTLKSIESQSGLFF